MLPKRKLRVKGTKPPEPPALPPETKAPELNISDLFRQKPGKGYLGKGQIAQSHADRIEQIYESANKKLIPSSVQLVKLIRDRTEFDVYESTVDGRYNLMHASMNKYARDGVWVLSIPIDKVNITDGDKSDWMSYLQS